MRIATCSFTRRHKSANVRFYYENAGVWLSVPRSVKHSADKFMCRDNALMDHMAYKQREERSARSETRAGDRKWHVQASCLSLIVGGSSIRRFGLAFDRGDCQSQIQQMRFFTQSQLGTQRFRPLASNGSIRGKKTGDY